MTINIDDIADRCTPNTETGSLNYRKFAELYKEAIIKELVNTLQYEIDTYWDKLGYKLDAYDCITIIQGHWNNT